MLLEFTCAVAAEGSSDLEGPDGIGHVSTAMQKQPMTKRHLIGDSTEKGSCKSYICMCVYSYYKARALEWFLEQGGIVMGNLCHFFGPAPINKDVRSSSHNLQ